MQGYDFLKGLIVDLNAQKQPQEIFENVSFAYKSYKNNCMPWVSLTAQTYWRDNVQSIRLNFEIETQDSPHFVDGNPLNLAGYKLAEDIVSYLKTKFKVGIWDISDISPAERIDSTESRFLLSILSVDLLEPISVLIDCLDIKKEE